MPGYGIALNIGTLCRETFAHRLYDSNFTDRIDHLAGKDVIKGEMRLKRLVRYSEKAVCYSFLASSRVFIEPL